MKPEIENFVSDYLGDLLEDSAAVFAGAGLSVPAGFVDWRELLRPISTELGLKIDLEPDLVAVAQFHVNANGLNRHRLHKAIIEALSATPQPTVNHRLLAQLPIRTWWTTNYDKLIETALSERNRIVDVKSAVQHTPKGLFYFRLVPLVQPRRFSLKRSWQSGISISPR